MISRRKFVKGAAATLLLAPAFPYLRSLAADVGEVGELLLHGHDAPGQPEEMVPPRQQPLHRAGAGVPGRVQPLGQLLAGGPLGEHPPGCAGHVGHVRRGTSGGRAGGRRG